MTITAPEPIPINWKDWKDILVRVCLPIGIMVFLVLWLMPIMLDELK